ncbi:MAG: hypothetical protein QOG15_3783 [Solirubrobacteraceae bacterium]|jgi:hypothetical protein|nr:hypothetical protein [Solirubrobacteraceae bacterium]
MWRNIANISSTTTPPSGAADAVVIRLACDEDMRLVRDLAALDGAAQLTGAVLLALVDGRPWTALSLEDRRTVADPFAPSASATALLRVRADQLRAVDSKHQRVPRARWIAGRARA